MYIKRTFLGVMWYVGVSIAFGSGNLYKILRSPLNYSFILLIGGINFMAVLPDGIIIEKLI